VFSLDWDLLIVLDTCRVDALRAIADEGRYGFLDPHEVDAMTSVGGSTLEWTASTFRRKHLSAIRNTALVSANGWPHNILENGDRPEVWDEVGPTWTNWKTVSDADLGLHRRAWKYGANREGVSDRPMADAGTVVDSVIKIGRTHDFNRTIAHLIEPHYPFSAAAQQVDMIDLVEMTPTPFEYYRQTGDHEPVWKHYLAAFKHGSDIDIKDLPDMGVSLFDYLRETGDRESVWQAYLTELRAGLDEIIRLLKTLTPRPWRSRPTTGKRSANGELTAIGAARSTHASAASRGSRRPLPIAASASRMWGWLMGRRLKIISGLPDISNSNDPEIKAGIKRLYHAATTVIRCVS